MRTVWTKKKNLLPQTVSEPIWSALIVSLPNDNKTMARRNRKPVALSAVNYVLRCDRTTGNLSVRIIRNESFFLLKVNLKKQTRKNVRDATR